MNIFEYKVSMAKLYNKEFHSVKLDHIDSDLSEYNLSELDGFLSFQYNSLIVYKIKFLYGT